ncbi:MAG: hypothetical protein RL660_1470 [Bacteroidota bacterium]|jgi:hypothetical protein
MKKIISTFVFAAFCFTSQAQVATWTDNVACILYTHCTSCHNANGIGPGDFTSYSNAAMYKTAIKNATSTRAMPPFKADLSYQHYTEERVLTQQEIDILASWADNNAPQGNGTAPVAPTYPNGATMQNADLVLQAPTYTVNTTAGDVYRCFVIPGGIATDKYITNIEVVPGNRPIVHHVLVFTDTSTVPATLDAGDPGPGYNSAGTGSNASTLVAGWVPGQGVINIAPGFGLRAPANTSYVIQIHYPSGINNLVDSTKVYLKFATSPVRTAFVSPVINHGPPSLQNGPLVIAANTTKTFIAKYTIPNFVNTSVLSVSPHMHKIGRNIKSFAVNTAGDTTKLINIPSWDFNWQGGYNFQKPIVLTGGSTIWANALYDNTTANPFNPSNPPQLVTLGEGTNDEMMLIYFTYALAMPGDENMVIDTVGRPDYYNGCGIGSVPNSIVDVTAQKPMLVPNPSTTSLTIVGNSQVAYKLIVVNTAGSVVLQSTLNGNGSLQHNLSPGLYRAIIFDGMTTSSENLLVR